MDTKTVLEKASDLILSYIEQNKNNPVINYCDAESLKKKVDLSLPQKPQSYDDIFRAIEMYLKYSVRTHHPQFFNQLYTGCTLPGLLGEIITALTNTSMYTFEVAPLATLIEKEMIDKLLILAQIPDGEGIFVTGGSNANLVAVMAARNALKSSIKNKGLYGEKKLQLFVSDQAHYSFKKAANILGIGSENVIVVESDIQGKMIPQLLEQKIIKSKDSGAYPFFVAGTAGTTVLGAFDTFNDIAALAGKYNLWFHIDGSFGASVLLSDKHKTLMEGVSLADSLAWNPHKMMNVPLTCSVILMKEKGTLLKTSSTDSGDYLFHDYENSSYDLGTMSLQCGRRVDAFKLWLCWKYYGDEGYRERINYLFALAQYVKEQIEKNEKLELVSPVFSINVCFRYRPIYNVDSDTFNIKLREKLVKSGKSLVNFAKVNGKVALRLVIVNADLQKSDLDLFLKNVIEVGETMDSSNKPDLPQ